MIEAFITFLAGAALVGFALTIMFLGAVNDAL